MDDIFTDFHRTMEAMTAPLGDYAPVARRLLADYKDSSGQDFHQDLLTYHNRGATDTDLIRSVCESLAGRGCKLTALMEFLDSGGRRVLYMAPGYLEEVIQELGLPVPADMAAAMRAAGIHPVNWEELCNPTGPAKPHPFQKPHGEPLVV